MWGKDPEVLRLSFGESSENVFGLRILIRKMMLLLMREKTDVGDEALLRLKIGAYSKS